MKWGLIHIILQMGTALAGKEAQDAEVCRSIISAAKASVTLTHMELRCLATFDRETARSQGRTS